MLMSLINSKYLKNGNLEIVNVAKGVIYYKLGAFCFDLELQRETEVHFKTCMKMFGDVSNQ